MDEPPATDADEGLDERDVDPDPFRQFARWFDDASTSAPQPEGMALATATPDGRPSVRMVLLKAFDERGFVFYTNERSQKGRELLANAHGAITIYWHPLHRQVRASGSVTRVAPEESDVYFASRPRGAQLAALASVQSTAIEDRDALMDAYRRLEAEHADHPVPRPAWWGGFRLRPDAIEFWQGRTNRLHDRLRYTRRPDGWGIERLAP